MKFNIIFKILKSLYSENTSLIALRIFAQNWNRHGKISLICLTLDEWTYIFDLFSILQDDDNGEDFIHLMNDLLAHPCILKVIQDCRFVSDMLFHQYGINLNNVFDIEVNF